MVKNPPNPPNSHPGFNYYLGWWNWLWVEEVAVMSEDDGESKVWATGGPVGVGGLVWIEKVLVLGRGQMIDFAFTKQKVHKKIRTTTLFHLTLHDDSLTKQCLNNKTLLARTLSNLAPPIFISDTLAKTMGMAYRMKLRRFWLGKTKKLYSKHV